MTYEDEWDDEDQEWLDDWSDEDDDPNAPCSPRRCGECWGGDGICMAEIDEQVRQEQEYYALYSKPGVSCPVCGLLLTHYEIPTSRLWQWPGDFYHPMIALELFAVYDAPKGLVHSAGDTCHIWVGEGEYRSEKLIRLNAPRRSTASGPAFMTPEPAWRDTSEELPF